ncbi:TetR/AcrR family transcriptional regulator [Pelagibacterium lacus]|nr:TetR/AcrR family transcriptional regulator [Pelagibacterium lacus]
MMVEIVGQRRKRPGRPEGQTHSREDILDASEILFAELGYAGTSLRYVAERVDITTALITYYFGSKENLFREVFLRKGREIAKSRMQGLAAILAETDAPQVEDLVRAFLAPSIKLRETRQGLAFLRLHSRLHMEPEALSYELRREVYDESTRAYATAFLAALPELTEATVYRRMSLMIGAYLYAFSDTNRLEELVPEQSPTPGIFYDLDEIVAFASAGMRAKSVA